MIAPLLAALSLGALGSLHCTLMCGPLLVAGCSRDRRSLLGYFAGRATSYAFFGALFGEAGRTAAVHLPAGTIQNSLLLAVAVVAAVRGLRLLLRRPRAGLVRLGTPGPWSRVARHLAALLPRHGLPLGLATGALPCGLLAGGWALAASTGHPLHGAIVMIAFSLATAPGLVAALLAARPLGRLGARLTPAWQGALWCALAIWIGARPLMDHACH